MEEMPYRIQMIYNTLLGDQMPCRVNRVYIEEGRYYVVLDMLNVNTGDPRFNNPSVKWIPFATVELVPRGELPQGQGVNNGQGG